MVFSKHLQQCIGLTLGAISTALVIKYRTKLFEYFKQNQRKKSNYDTWVIYSGSQCLPWIHGTLIPQKAKERIALDVITDIPGKYRSDNIILLAEKSEKVLIVLGPEIFDNKWFRFQLEVALQMFPDKMSIQFIDKSCSDTNTIVQIDHIVRKCNREVQYECDFWLVYSGSQSQRCFVDHILPVMDKKVVSDFNCYVPGKTDLENIMEAANKAKKVIIILGPESHLNELLRYEIEHALMKGPGNALLCKILGDGDIPDFSCLRPLPTICIEPTQPYEGTMAVKQFLSE